MRRLAWLAVLVAACSAQPAASPNSPATNASKQSPASCRLAVISGSPGQTGAPFHPGFLTIPGETFTPATDAGDSRLFYSRQLVRWVEWPPSAYSADGLTLAYIDGDKNSSRLHLVDVKTTKDRVLAEGGPWMISGFQMDGVYVMRVAYSATVAFGEMTFGKGLWKVPLDGGVPVQLTFDSRNWPVVSGGFAWGEGFTTNISGSPNEILRLDLRTKQTQTWFEPGKRSYVLAIDSSGAPLISAEADVHELWRVPSPDRAVKVWSATRTEMGPNGPAVVDGGVVWFSSWSMSREWGIYRYSAAKGVELVARFSDRPVWVAGPCV
jgi:hypothetical protein